jgi:RNA polymerase sigma-70 factor (ECF subfamily)
VKVVHAELSDDILVKAACRGDVDSFAELYQRHLAMALGIAYCQLSDRALAEDAAQESFAEACRNLQKLRDGRKFPHWLAAICRRIAGRMKKARRHHGPLVEQEQVARANDDESYEVIRAAVERLPQVSKEVIVLRYFSESTHEQIAHALNITPAAVHGRLTRAKEQLKHDLTRQGLGVNTP